MLNSPIRKKVNFQEIIRALLDESTLFPPIYLHHFSDLSDIDLRQLKAVWPKINFDRKLNLLVDIKELSESDTTTSFENLAEITLVDPDSRIRIAGLGILWDTEDFHHIPKVMELFEKDPDSQVRAGAAEVLGEFVYLGELDKIPSNYHHIVEDSLISCYKTCLDNRIKQKIVEALGYSSREEATEILYFAYREKDPGWIASALIAMGRSADKRWEKPVVDSLQNSNNRIRLEAVRAAGELELEAAKPIILNLLKNASKEDDLYNVAIWSLSQIGGDEVRDYLENLLDQTDDDEEIEYLEEALENLNFSQGAQQFRMFAFEKPPKGKWMREIQLEDEIEENNDFKIEDEDDDRR